MYTSLQLVTAFLALAAATPAAAVGPKLHSTFPEQTVQAGQRVSLRCVASGSIPLHFYWLLDGEMLIPWNRERCGRPSHFHLWDYDIGTQHLRRYVVSHLNISRVNPQYGGVYTCKAHNPVGSVAHSAALNVYVLDHQTPEQKAARAVCRYKGKQYPLGAKFYPDEEPCTICICQFNRSLVEPFCKKINCNLELVYENQMIDGCVPVHSEEDGCCPDLWRCQAKSDTAVSESSDENDSSNFDSGLHCKLGDVVMNKWDELSPSNNSSEYDLSCTCWSPPHPSCYISLKYPIPYPKHPIP